ISELESEASNLESNSSTQLVLRRSAENSLSNTERSLTSVRTERDNLQATKRDLESRVSDLRSSKNQLALVQKSEREKQTKIDELTRQLTTLQITNNNINREISEKKNEIKNLKGDLNLSREEFLNQKIGLKEEKLETLVQQLGVNQGQIINLRNAYKQLIEARRNFNQVNINAANGNVNNIRVALVVNPADRQKICRKCEKLVKLEMELNQIYQQQFEARQEMKSSDGDSANINEMLEELARMSAKNQYDMIQTIEKTFILYGVSPSDLDSTEMPVTEVPTDFVKFQTLLYDKIVEVGERKVKAQKKKEEKFSSNEKKILRTEWKYYQTNQAQKKQNKQSFQDLKRGIDEVKKKLEEIDKRKSTGFSSMPGTEDSSLQDYCSDDLTHNQLINEIRKLKQEVEELKTDKSIS
ncbi:17427_t:CDS:2, partial [Funneliformis geosporum]